MSLAPGKNETRIITMLHISPESSLYIFLCISGNLLKFINGNQTRLIRLL